MKEVLEELEIRRDRARAGGGTARIEAQHKRGKLTARERIELLLDENSFEEFDMYRRAPLHRFRHGEDQECRATAWSPAGAPINGRIAYVFAKDFTVFGGSLSEAHAKKIIKVQDMALRNRAPIIGLFDAGGARIQEGVAALGGYGEVFLRNVLASGVIPQITRDHGAVRRRRRLLAGHDRLHLHGEGHELHVRHRPGRGEDGHQRDGHRRGARRRARAHDQILDRRRRLRERRRDAAADAPADRLPAVEQRVGRARAADSTTRATATSPRSTR